VFTRIAQEDAGNRAWSQFVGCSGSEIGVTKAAENLESNIGWMLVMEGKERGGVELFVGRSDVEQIRGCPEGLSPVNRRHGGLEEQSAQNVIDGAQGSFCFAILW
jgi:hypothetical protein